MEKGANKAGIRPSDVMVTRVASLLSMLRVWVIAGTILVICLGVIAVAWAMKRH
ncbi:MAG TPA: hypothetical protein VEN81_16390 [Planctomycetota bacterium]|nr:hypothetical protein [Planctomycetota bacterium]